MCLKYSYFLSPCFYVIPSCVLDPRKKLTSNSFELLFLNPKQKIQTKATILTIRGGIQKIWNHQKLKPIQWLTFDTAFVNNAHNICVILSIDFICFISFWLSLCILDLLSNSHYYPALRQLNVDVKNIEKKIDVEYILMNVWHVYWHFHYVSYVANEHISSI